MPSKKSSPAAKESQPLLLRLTDLQRKTMLDILELPPEMEKRIEAAPKGPQDIEFTLQELDRLESELICVKGLIRRAPSVQIEAVLKQVSSLLDAQLDHPEGTACRRERPADESALIMQFKIAPALQRFTSSATL